MIILDELQLFCPKIVEKSIDIAKLDFVEERILEAKKRFLKRYKKFKFLYIVRSENKNIQKFGNSSVAIEEFPTVKDNKEALYKGMLGHSVFL